MKEENRFYNYVYLDPRKPGNYIYFLEDKEFKFNYEPFYIGKGQGRRYLEHLKYESQGSGFMKNKMKNFRKNNVNPEILLLNNNLSNNEVIEIEKQLIKVIGRRDLKLGPLVNLTNGGEGFVGYKRSKETTNKIIKSRMSRPRSIKEIEHNEKLIKVNIGKQFDFNKGVYQIHKITDVILNEFRTTRDAEKATGVCFTNISAVCSNKRKTAGGFKWKYIK